MRNDPIVEEIHQTRDRIAARFDFDVHKLGAYYIELQKKHANRLVSFPPRRPAGWSPGMSAIDCVNTQQPAVLAENSSPKQ